MRIRESGGERKKEAACFSGKRRTNLVPKVLAESRDQWSVPRSYPPTSVPPFWSTERVASDPASGPESVPTPPRVSPKFPAPSTWARGLSAAATAADRSRACRLSPRPIRPDSPSSTATVCPACGRDRQPFPTQPRQTFIWQEANWGKLSFCRLWFSLFPDIKLSRAFWTFNWY